MTPANYIIIGVKDCTVLCNRTDKTRLWQRMDWVTSEDCELSKIEDAVRQYKRPIDNRDCIYTCVAEYANFDFECDLAILACK